MKIRMLLGAVSLALASLAIATTGCFWWPIVVHGSTRFYEPNLYILYTEVGVTCLYGILGIVGFLIFIKRSADDE